MIEKPFSPAQLMASAEEAASQTGGCGFCAGLGSTSTSSNCQNRPLKLTRSLVQASITTCTFSRKSG